MERENELVVCKTVQRATKSFCSHFAHSACEKTAMEF